MGQSSFCLDLYLFLWYNIGDIWADIFYSAQVESLKMKEVMKNYKSISLTKKALGKVNMEVNDE